MEPKKEIFYFGRSFLCYGSNFFVYHCFPASFAGARRKVTSNGYEDTFAGRKEKLKKADKEASDLIKSFGFNSAVSVAVCLFAVLFYDQFNKQI